MADTMLAPPTSAATKAAPPRARRRRATRSMLGLRTLAILYIGILVLVPLVVVTYRAFSPGLTAFGNALTDQFTVHALRLSLEIAASAVAINTVFGIGVALLLARHRFPGQRLLSALIDLPVSISPIVVGLALVLVYGPFGWFGGLSTSGFQIINALPSMIMATVFVSLPLVVRAIVPVLEQEGMEQDQAAQSLGANAWQRFLRITLPTIRSAVAYGVVLAIARSLGEYGAVLVVSGNIEGQTETLTLRIDTLYEADQQTNAAYALTFVLVFVAIVAIVVASLLRRREVES